MEINGTKIKEIIDIAMKKLTLVTKLYNDIMYPDYQRLFIIDEIKYAIDRGDLKPLTENQIENLADHIMNDDWLWQGFNEALSYTFDDANNGKIKEIELIKPFKINNTGGNE